MIKPFLPSEIVIGPIRFHIYGMLIGVGVWLIYQTVDKKYNKLIKRADYIAALLLTLLGARLYHVIDLWSFYRHVPAQSFNLTDGGLSIYGAFIGILIAVGYISRQRKLKLYELFDTLLIYMPLAQAIGRWGNFFNYELYGPPLKSWFALYIPENKRIAGYSKYDSFHPVFFYEFVLNLANFWVLKAIAKQKLSHGMITGVYLFNYGIIRLLMNRIRLDTTIVSDLFAITLIVSGAIISGVLLIQKRKR